jgi:cyclopropane fatty-acyl-phospholipid synthase-like methyltransferase
MLRFGPNPAATVYDSIGTDFILALAPGWLNLGLWEGDGTDLDEARSAPRRLVERLALDLPRGADLLDVGNGLGVQDPVIAEICRPRRLVALNVTISQLRAGRGHLERAGAWAVNGDATRIPLRDGSVDGVISVEAAFHFPSRAAFFREAARVLRPGGVLTMSDVPITRRPRGVRETVAGLSQLRLWGLTVRSAATAREIVAMAERAGFADVETRLAGDRVIAPALRHVRRRLDEERGRVPRSFEAAGRIMLREVEVLWERGILEYLFLRARRPG